MGFAAVFNVNDAAGLQSALDTVDSNGQDDIINIAAGTYNGSPFTYSGINTENFALTINGAGAGMTFLDDGGANTRVLLINNIAVAPSTNADITIQNLTIQNGNQLNGLGGGLRVLSPPDVTIDSTVTIENCEFSGNSVSAFSSGGVTGGGAHITGGNVTLTNNIFTNNSATNTADAATGGGVTVTATAGDITLTNNTFNSNSASGGSAQGGGSRVAAIAGTVTLTNNIFTNNTVTNPFSSQSAVGGGADIGGVTVILTDNTFDGNTVSSSSSSGGQGGGVSVQSGGTVTLTNNAFDNNSVTSTSGGGIIFGGGAYVNVPGNIGLTNNTFTNNSADNSSGLAAGGGAFVQPGGNVTLTNNTFTLNSTSASGVEPFFNGDGGGLFALGFVDTSIINIYNNIVFGNIAVTGSGDDIYVFDDGEGNSIGSFLNLFNNDFTDFFSFCIIPCVPNITMVDNIDADPLFVNAPNGDVHIQTGSPAIDAGNSAPPIPPGLPATDFEGDPRDSNPDIGADEFVSATGACGDGNLDSGEQCDDGNTDNGDCCSSTCQLDTAGTACGSSADTDCDNPDTCNASGLCQTNNEADGFACTDDGVECTNDQCSAGVCAHPSKAAGTACGSSDSTDCNAPDTCDGVVTCVDRKDPAGTVCLAGTGTCDPNDTCNGVSNACTPIFAPGGTACNSPANTNCDNPDSCNGSGICQANNEPNGTSCSDGNNCTQIDTCQSGNCTGGNIVMCAGLPATICGTAGNENLNGTNGPDVMHGLGGNDNIFGRNGNDKICGGDGNDDISGQGGNDALDGEGNTDKCTGGPGSDTAVNCETVKSVP